MVQARGEGKRGEGFSATWRLFTERMWEKSLVPVKIVMLLLLFILQSRPMQGWTFVGGISYLPASNSGPD